MITVNFLNENITVSVEPGTTLLTAQIAAGLMPDAPCGGMGVCGKCLVEMQTETGSWLTVKACTTPADRDMCVRTLRKDGSHRILTEGVGSLDEVAPPVRSSMLRVEKPTLAEPSADWERVSRAMEKTCGVRPEPDLVIATGLRKTLEELEYAPQAVYFRNELLCLRKGGSVLTAAVDIGTTTVVLYLADSGTGELLATGSRLNPQTEFGADVISRANYAMLHGTEALSKAIWGAIQELLKQAIQDAGAKAEDVFSLIAVGNTCMHHLLLGLDPSSLVLSPYVPSISDMLILNAADYCDGIHPRGKLIVLPCIAGFVGADTTAVMLSCEFDQREHLTLAIDIGTNGELVLGDRFRTVACSTAAGPAFEGAKISCGMRGAEGAIDHAAWKDGQFTFSVIGVGAPKGICGSGLLDLTAALLSAGLLDETGRFADDDEIPAEAEVLACRLKTVDSQRVFVLSDPEPDRPAVCLTQRDIREVQLAKAAMAAGIELMLEHLDRRVEEIEEVLIAGAFGNYMSPESACAIGLIPRAFLGRIQTVGNAAGSGALLCALNEASLRRTVSMVQKTEFLELASNPEFQDRFVDALNFPEEEL